MLRSDETKMRLFGINSTRCIWRKTNAEYDIKNTIPTVKHGGGSICFEAVFLLSVQDDFSGLNLGQEPPSLSQKQ